MASSAIVIRLIGDSSDFNRGLQQAESGMDKFKKNLNRAAVGIAAGVAAGAAAQAAASRTVATTNARAGRMGPPDRDAGAGAATPPASPRRSGP